MPDHIVQFQLDRPGDGPAVRMTYRPWGTRSLKVRVSTARPMPALRLRPRNVLPAEAEAGVFRAYADASRAIVVTWGGGHEPGPCVRSEDFLKAFERCAEIEPGADSVIFFNVSHVGPEVPAKDTLTLEAYDESTGDVHARLPVHLEAPAALPDDLVRMVEVGEDVWQPGEGGLLPAYDARWWPAAEVAYVAHDPPPIRVVRQDNELRFLWRDEPEPIATVVDHTDPSILGRDAVSFELFAFDHGLLVLRSWFFWVDKNMGHGFFVGRHEVPDVERFDMVIRPADGRVILACSDAHWREIWGEVPEPPAPSLAATIGLSREAKLRLLEMSLGLSGHGDDAHAHHGPYDPVTFIRGLAALRAAPGPAEAPTRAKGTEAHLPTLENVRQPEPARMTSSDVRLG